MRYASGPRVLFDALVEKAIRTDGDVEVCASLEAAARVYVVECPPDRDRICEELGRVLDALDASGSLTSPRP